MKRIIYVAFILFFHVTGMYAHDAHYEGTPMRQWHLENPKQTIEGSYLMEKNGEAYIQDAEGKVFHYPVIAFSRNDRNYLEGKMHAIEKINHQHHHCDGSESKNTGLTQTQVMIMAFSVILLVVMMFLYFRKGERKYFLVALSLLLLFAVSGFTSRVLMKKESNTDPVWMDSTFAPFRPHVHTFFDANYFYVESKGIPATHEMMKGISNHGWQQQVPIPQCYIGSNAWPIPLNPVMSSSPIPVDSIHFTRGAIAIAANGVPIFNYHTNTGVDSYLDGQLDNYGGHCGRADDYHYHTAPLHLSAHTAVNLPIAFGLDGYAVYGPTEPDGSPMSPLDAGHGHFAGNGVYHYHGTPSAPYMMGMVMGQVTEDNTHQLIPQAKAKPVRPSLTPLNGALITGCRPNGTNTGYTLTYTLSGSNDSIIYGWNPQGVYTFDFYTASGHVTQTYQGFVQCSVPVTTSIPFKDRVEKNLLVTSENNVLIIRCLDAELKRSVKRVFVAGMDGKEMYADSMLPENIDVSGFAKGAYVLHIVCRDRRITEKFIIR